MLSAAALMLVLMAAVAADAGDSGIQLVSYTTGQNGSPLKWLPHKSAAEAGVLHAAAEQVTGEPKPAEELSLPKPLSILSNPFQDPRAKPSVVAPSKPDGLSEQFSVPIKTPGSPRPESKPQAGKADVVPLFPALPFAAPGLNGAQRGAPKSEIPQLELALAADDCPKPGDMKPVSEAEILEKVPLARDPNARFPLACPLPHVDQTPRGEMPFTFTWKASALCHKPAYFEDVQLERYGHSWGPIVQPVMSGAHFIATVPALPYLMALNPPNECVYTLGYYRPGSCAPYMLDPLPLSIRAALVEGGVVTALVFLIP